MTSERQPPEPPEARSPDRDGVLRVTTGSLKLPEGIEADETSRRDGMNTVVLVVVGLALAFIAFIAWLIHGGQ